MSTYFANTSEAQLYRAVSTSTPEPGQDHAATNGGNNASNAGDEAHSLMDGAEPLTPPNPNRFSMFSPSIGGSVGESMRDSMVSSANSSRPIVGAAAAIAGADAGAEVGAGMGTPGDSADTSGVSSALASKERVVDESAEPITSATVAGGKRRKMWWIAGALALIVAAAVAIPVGVILAKNNDSDDNSSPASTESGSSGNGANTPPVSAVITGGDGSTVTKDDGTTFTYTNKFGGYWVDDPSNPFNNGARPNSWTPPLNTSWQWGVDKVYGVNIGGLFVLEPFIVPSLFQKYLAQGVEDEWTLSQAMAADSSPGGGLESQMENHYDTFITEEDIAQIAGAGLNWIRLPIPFWAVDDWKTSSVTEPFLARTCWKYILRIVRWCRKYGIRVKLDLHTAPGSQNGYNHSGKSGQINFLKGIMGYANAQRMLGYIRIITEFFAQPEYKDVVQIFGIVNEPRGSDIGKEVLSHFYLQVHDLMRGITGFGEGNGPYISIHDGFLGLAEWADFLPGADRINLDVHPYFAFNGQPNTDPIGVWPERACNAWASMINTSQISYGVTIAGEFSNGINDCGLFLNGVSDTHTYGGDCAFWEDSTQWNQTIIDGLRDFTMASFDSLQNWFFWTWKIGNSTANRVETPLWSYKAGLEGGWMPTDPRAASGFCASLGISGPSFDGTFNAWATGGTGAGTISADQRSSFSAWPPASVSGVDGPMEFVPTYTATGTVSTLPPDSALATRTPTPTVSLGDGWVDAGDDSVGGVTEVAGCSYPNPWDSSGMVMPTATCTGAAAARFARRTPPPVL